MRGGSARGAGAEADSVVRVTRFRPLGSLASRPLGASIPFVIPVPPELVWDYPEAPADELWRLQRVAEFFPLYGRQRATIAALYRRRDELRVPPETKELIAMYARRIGVAG